MPFFPAPLPVQHPFLASGMKGQSLAFLLGSICLHLGAFSTQWQVATFEQGVARATKNAGASRAVLTVDLLAAQNMPETKKEAVAAPNVTDVPAIGVPEKSGPAVAGARYLPAGRLTRLPSPLGDIDLNLALPDDDTITAKIELAVPIDSHGRVADVIVPPQSDKKTNAFAQSVAERFKNARFSPGEIDGKAVRSQLRITVVSESLP